MLALCVAAHAVVVASHDASPTHVRSVYSHDSFPPCWTPSFPHLTGADFVQCLTCNVCGAGFIIDAVANAVLCAGWVMYSIWVTSAVRVWSTHWCLLSFISIATLE